MDYGKITHNGLDIGITQLPYISDCGNYYKAVGIDSEANDYEIIWPVVDIDCEDESDACDWTDFRVKKI